MSTDISLNSEIEKIIKDNFNNIEKQVSDVVRNYINSESRKIIDRFSFTEIEEINLVNKVETTENIWKKIDDTT